MTAVLVLVLLVVFASVQISNGFAPIVPNSRRYSIADDRRALTASSMTNVNKLAAVPTSTRDASIVDIKSKASAFAALILAPMMVTTSVAPGRAVAAATEADFIDLLATVYEDKNIIEPARKAVLDQRYDAARSNIQYILNQQQLQKKLTALIQASLDFSENVDAIDAAADAGNRLTNTVLQYDGSVYTCIFLFSSDGTVPPSAEKYRAEALKYHDAFVADLDIMLSLGNESQLAAAKKKADAAVAQMPKVLFKTS
jgi:hypothetical protein